MDDNRSEKLEELKKKSPHVVTTWTNKKQERNSYKLNGKLRRSEWCCK